MDSVATDAGSLILSYLDASQVCRLSHASKRFKECCERSLVVERPVGFCRSPKAAGSESTNEKGPQVVTRAELESIINASEAEAAAAAAAAAATAAASSPDGASESAADGEHAVARAVPAANRAPQTRDACAELLKRCPRATRFYEADPSVLKSVDQAVAAGLPIHHELIHSDLAQFPANTKFSCVRSLAIRHTSFPLDSLRATFPNLRKLSVHPHVAMPQTPFPLHVLAKECPNLTALSFDAVPSTVATCESDSIALPESLTDVRFVDMRFSMPIFVDFVRVLPATLRVLWIDTFGAVQEDARELMCTRFQNVEELRSSNLGDETVSSLLAAVPSLTSLHSCSIAALKAQHHPAADTKPFPNLRKVSLRIEAEDGSTRGLAALPDLLPNVTWLSLRLTGGRKMLLAPRALHLPALEHLALENFALMSSSISTLEHAPELRSLSICEEDFLVCVPAQYVLLAKVLGSSKVHTLSIASKGPRFLPQMLKLLAHVPQLKMLDCTVHFNPPGVAEGLEKFRQEHGHPRCVKVNGKLCPEYARPASCGEAPMEFVELY